MFLSIEIRLGISDIPLLIRFQTISGEQNKKSCLDSAYYPFKFYSLALMGFLFLLGQESVKYIYFDKRNALKRPNFLLNVQQIIIILVRTGHDMDQS